MKNAKIEEVFINGLSKRCRLELVRLNITTFADAFNIINETEETMIDQLREMSKNNKRKSHQINNESKTNKMSFNKENKREFNNDKPKTKWCEFHKSKSHNTQECRRRTAETKSENKKETFAVREATLIPKTIDLDIIIKGKKVKALIDTGAAENYVCQNLIRDLNIPMQPLKECLTAEMANGFTTQVENSASISFNIQGDTMIEYKTECRVLPSLSSELLLGMVFLVNNDAVINMKDDILTLDGKQYEIKTTDSHKNDVNENIMNKTKIFSCADSSKTEVQITQLLESFKKSTPVLGKINISEHSITLTDEKPIA
jgi:hypothetical protein